MKTNLQKPSQLPLVILAVVAGSLSGALVSGIASRSDNRAPATIVHATPSPSAAGPSAAPANEAMRDLGFASRLSKLEETAAKNGNAAAAPSASPSLGASVAADGPPAEFYYRRHEEVIKQARAEAVDPAWGPPMSEYLRPDLQKAKALVAFDLVEVDCRTASCLAVMQWNTRSEALDAYHKVMATPFRVNCEHSVLVPEQPAANGKWQATMTFDCNDWRANGSELAPDISVAQSN